MSTRRASTDDRRDQILRATLDLLATTPLDRVTTRQIATRVGVSQPALFRHFEDRDAIVAAAVAWTRGELEGLVARVLTEDAPALDRAEALARGLGEHAVRYPGLPRLLFADAARGEGEGLGASLRHLVALQRGLVAELVRDAARAGDVPAEVDADRAGTLFVAGLQGLLLQWQMTGGRAAPDVDALVRHWRAGLAAGEPRARETGAAGPRSAPTPTPPSPDQAVAVPAEPPAKRTPRPPGPVVPLDARALIARGVDPLEDILAAVRVLPAGATLRVVAPFRPTPLLALLRSRGWMVEATPLHDGDWQVDVHEAPPRPGAAATAAVDAAVAPAPAATDAPEAPAPVASARRRP